MIVLAHFCKILLKVGTTFDPDIQLTSRILNDAKNNSLTWALIRIFFSMHTNHNLFISQTHEIVC